MCCLLSTVSFSMVPMDDDEKTEEVGWVCGGYFILTAVSVYCFGSPQYVRHRRRCARSALRSSRLLQVIDRPDPERDGGDGPPETEEQDGPVPPVQRGPHHIPHLLGVPSARPGALRTPEALALFLEKHARAFVLAMTTSERVW